MTINWTGVFPALVTPFSRDGQLDKSKLAHLVDLVVSEGVSGIVVGGSTGEYYSMTVPERLELFTAVKDLVPESCVLIAGTSSINHVETIELTGEAKQIGYDGCMVLPPVYSLPTPTEILKAFEEVASVGLPVMVYNNPARAGVGLNPGLVQKLAQMENIVAYKESSRDLYVISEIFHTTRDQVALFAGLEPYGSALLSRGAVGIVSTISNVCAREVVAYYQAYKNNDQATLSQMQQIIDEIYHLIPRVGMSNYAFVKSAMTALGRPSGVPRRPHYLADDALIEKIGKEIRDIYARAGVAR